MGDPIKNITIVGGGTAGWMAALILQSYFGTRAAQGQGKTVTLIESPNVPTVGVGEATVPGMPRTLRMGGVSEPEFFKTCNASFKLGVLFSNWNVDKAGHPIEFVNPFARAHPIHGVDLGYYFLQHGAGNLDFTQVYSPAVDLGRACKGPRALGEKPYSMSIGHAYHLDAGKFSGLMQRLCTEKGVVHVRDDVVHVEQDENGYVTALQLKRGGRHETELVIDCTGFKGVIINEVLKEPFISYSKYLANDRAMAVQIPHPDPDKIPSLTRSYALGAGWVWRVPLFNRIGTGYVYSTAHRTDEEARDEFVAHLGDTWNGVEPRVIPMRVGRNRNAWVKNVVAIGLSGGFIEPLESTAIHMIDMGVRWLISYFPDSDFPAPLRDRYNKITGNLYDEVRDFICLHYALNNRTDSQYWIDAREELEVPDSLAANLDLWRYTLPQPYDLAFDSLFDYGVYQAVMLGKRVYDTDYASPHLLRNMTLPSDIWGQYLTKMRGGVANAMNHVADHRTLLLELRGELPVPNPPPNFAMAQPTVAMPGQPLPKVPITNPNPAPKPAAQAVDDDGVSLL
ncbi:tryptophan halogenase family protein [Nioella nitratireducens]|uniref:tryptophan halogenase family protein n=1 Tax=Nioella nitratireducens TaxID=1287720 RepID=UPI0008FD3CE5|nr:tryptophan halogenase family protein [Nioella nitratireducens]